MLKLPAMHLWKLLPLLILFLLLAAVQPVSAGVFAFGAGHIQPVHAFQVTPTPLPSNPAVIGGVQIIYSIVQGVIIVLILFLAFGIYLGIRRLLREL